MATNETSYIIKNIKYLNEENQLSIKFSGINPLKVEEFQINIFSYSSQHNYSIIDQGFVSIIFKDNRKYFLP